MSLCLEAVPARLLDLLRKLMISDPVRPFYLVGGTSLALRYGHRVSVDLDFFTHEAFDSRRLAEYLIEEYGLTESVVEPNTVLGLIDGVKTDFIAHRYPLISGVETVEGVRLLGSEDVAAMKLNAIANRGSKKDFWDFRELLRHFSRSQLLSFYSTKYPEGSLWNVEKSLSYFDDAEDEPDPKCLKGLRWPQIRAEIAESNRI